MTTAGQKFPGLIGAAIERPVSVIALVLLTLFFGVLSIVNLPIQLTPDISQPTITVATRWPGASPLEVEAELLEEQEEVLKRVQGLVRMESIARLNGGEVTLEFEVGTDLEQALVRVSNQLSQVPRYPDNADQPVVSTANAAGPPLAVILIRHEHGGSVQGYRTWVENEILPEIERIDGVASVFLRGGRTSEIHIDFDPSALAARGLTVPQVVHKVRLELRNVSAGELDVGKRRMLVRTLTAPEKIEGLAQVVLRVGDNDTPVRLGDVAKVSVALRRASDLAIGDDREAIALLPRRESGSNVLEVTQALRSVVQRLDERRFAPEGLKLEVVDDQSGYILDALSEVRKNLLIGAALATFTLLLFLRSVAASAIVALAIPICVLATGMGMALLGRSVNVVSLAGITFAVGMVVDNSIVALENIDTWRAKTHSAAEAAYRAIREVWGALLASTATTAAVFIPILLWEGEVGELLRDVAYAIALAVIISFVVSVLVIPSLAAQFLKPKLPSTTLAFDSAKPSLARRFRERVARSTHWLSATPWRSASVTSICMVGAVGAAWLYFPPMEYLPTGNRNLVFGIVLPPPGYSIDEVSDTGFANQKVMQRHTGVELDGVPAVHRSFFVGDPSLLLIGGVASDANRVGELRDFMRQLHARIPGTIGFASQAALFASGLGEGRAIEVELAGADLPELIGFAQQLFGQLRDVVPGAQVRPVPVLDLGAPEFHLEPDRVRAARAGFSPADVALIADSYVDGAIVGQFGESGKRKLDVVMRAQFDTSNPGQPKRPHDALSEHEFLQAPVALPSGLMVPLSTLATLRSTIGPSSVQRIERSRSVVLQVTPPDSVPFEAAIAQVETHIDALQARGEVPAGIAVNLGGSAGKLAQARAQFFWILGFAIVILFLLLAALFEDFVAPLVVLTTVPLAAAGGVVGLALANSTLAAQPLDLMSALGFLILFGVVVNNAILIIDGALARLKQGQALAEATADAVKSRVRPIFMSVLTSLAGLLPMVLSTASGSELYRGVGTVVLGGLVVSTLLSLVVVPSLFTLVWRAKAALVSTLEESSVTRPVP